MTQDQLMALARQLIPLLGGIAISLGWLTADQVGYWTGVLMQIAGPALTLFGIIWAFVANSKASIVKSVAAMPETKVSSTGKIEILDPKLAEVAAKAATPPGV